MRLILLVACAVLGGCFVTQEEWAAAERLCKQNGGVRWVDVSGISAASIECMNGANFSRAVAKAKELK